MPYSAQHSATIRQALPATSTSGLGLLGRELRGALRRQRVLLPDERVALLAHVHHDLGVGPERGRQRAGVADGHGRPARAIADAEVRRLARLAVAGDDLAG